MFRTNDQWCDEEWTRFARRLLNETSIKGYRMIEVTERFLFHIDAKPLQDRNSHNAYQHFQLNSIEDVISFLEHSYSTDIKIGLQSAFVENSNYEIKAVSRIYLGTDSADMTMALCVFEDGTTMTMPGVTQDWNGTRNRRILWEKNC